MIQFIEGFLSQQDADRLFAVSQALNWQQNSMRMYGKEIQLPRLEVMHGDKGCTYQYSNVLLSPEAWFPELLEMRSRLEDFTGSSYQVAIGNYYRSGSDHIGWHSDDSPEMGQRPAIASISLGATRRFHVKNKRTKETQAFDLAHGSLVFMPAGFQDTHVHRLAKTAKAVDRRINWTFRPHLNRASKYRQLAIAGGTHV